MPCVVFLALEYTGGVPYELIRPVLERANSHQLYSLEHHNAYLLEDTDELWKVLCQKEYRKAVREEMETWRDLYLVRSLPSYSSYFSLYKFTISKFRDSIEMSRGT